MKRFVLFSLFSFFLSAGFLNTSVTFAQDLTPTKVTLKVGDKAPKLYVQKWIKGKPITNWKGKNYLIEFSAVGCAPCRASIPMLSKMAETYAGKVDILSIYTLESNKSDNNDLRYVTRIKNLVGKYGNQIKFSVVADVPSQRSAQEWMMASGQNAIPVSYLVNKKGKIVWMGHVMYAEAAIQALFSEDSEKNLMTVNKKSKKEQLELELLGDKIHRNTVSGKFSTALKSVDSLIFARPEIREFYSEKFRVLAAYDVQSANELLKWMLVEQQFNGYDWYHLIYYTYTTPKPPDFTLAIKVANRAVSEAATDELAAYALIEKANIYGKLKRYNDAVVTCDSAFALCNTQEGCNTKHIEDNLNYFKEMRAKLGN